MDDPCAVPILPPEIEPVVDLSVLGRLVDLGDLAMRRALCEQLVRDFRRIEEGLAVNQPAQVAAAAHELKGLAGTIGALRLADMAQSLHRTAGTISARALGAVALPVRSEISRVLIILTDFEQSCRE